MIDWGETALSVMSRIDDFKHKEPKNILVILSGGMDSATCLAIAKEVTMHGGKVEGITFDYGQQHDKEIICAREIGWEMQADVHTIDLHDLASNFKTALKKDSDIEIPDGVVEGVPDTYVPFRNSIMIAVAAGYAQSWGFDTIFYGANIIDYSGYPDCRPEYIQQMNDVIHTHDEHLNLEAPILYLNKAEVVKLGTHLNVPWDKTWSCYRGGQYACGKCPSCEFRLKGFIEAEIADPLVYEGEMKHA